MSKLPILMYHHVHLQKGGGLTIQKDVLEAQFAYLAKKGYTTYHCSELIHSSKISKGKNIVITFDDAYVSQLELAYPLLLKYKLKATFFVPLKYVGKTDEWNHPTAPIMSVEQLKSLDPEVVELAYHSYAHQRYDELTKEEVEEDTEKSIAIVSEHKLPFSSVLAYPYGKYPRKGEAKREFFKHLMSNNFKYGFRIGNRINTFPFENPFEIQRIDVKGGWGLSKFKLKIKLGKLI